MPRPPLISRETVERALQKVKKGGATGFQTLLTEEPVLHRYLVSILKEAASTILQGRSISSPSDQQLLKKDLIALQVAVLRAVATTRECYRDLAENLLAGQMRLPGRPPSNGQAPGPCNP